MAKKKVTKKKSEDPSEFKLDFTGAATIILEISKENGPMVFRFHDKQLVLAVIRTIIKSQSTMTVDAYDKLEESVARGLLPD